MSYPFNIDVYGRKISTGSADAQIWFNRGLTWSYSYHFEESAACFRKAIAADPDCAMAHWGLAYSVGPDYNMPWHRRDANMKQATLTEAHSATMRALELLDGVTAQERALIEALPARYPQAEVISGRAMSEWNTDFANAMRRVHKAYPDDLDVRAIFVEAIMNCTPWDMWNQQTGAPSEGAGTLEAQAVLEEVLNGDGPATRHPGLLHLYVHLMEMSPTPEKALRAGDALRTLLVDAGHMIHMPTHIDIQCGNYQDVVQWNTAAMDADEIALNAMDGPSLYTGYCVHNAHFAVYGAMFLGQYATAMAAADRLLTRIPEDLLRVESPPFADFLESYTAIPVHVMIRFGKWAEIVALPLPEDRDLYCNLTATIHYAKGVAHAALGQVAQAEAEEAHFHAARDAVGEDRRLHNVRCQQQLEVATQMLRGEIEYRKENYDLAFDHLRRAVALEDALPYDEPWGWMQPTRHALGALLLEQGRVEDAKTTYGEDLGLVGGLTRAQVHPDNIWALKGFYDCLLKSESAEPGLKQAIKQRLDFAQARADGPVSVSCFCATQSAQQG